MTLCWGGLEEVEEEATDQNVQNINSRRLANKNAWEGRRKRPGQIPGKDQTWVRLNIAQCDPVTLGHT